MDKNFKDLLTKYVNGECTAQEQEKVEQWYEMIAEGELQLDPEEEARIGARMLARIEQSAEQKFTRRIIPISIPYVRIAAAITVLVAFGLWFFDDTGLFTSRPHDQVTAENYIIYQNSFDSAIQHALPDGSTIRLEPSGTLRYAKDFSSGDREVHLTGKAFFDIERDPARPFYVYSGKIATRVLGTSFFVDAPAGANKVGVKVVTGKVSVFEVKTEEDQSPRNSTTNGVVLSPNQTVDYYVEQGHWVTGLIEDPLPLDAQDLHASSFVYSAAPVRDIFEDIHVRFGIEVVTENDNITRCTFTGDVSKMPLYDMLDVISNSIGSTYEVKGTRILISGKGCDVVTEKNAH